MLKKLFHKRKPQIKSSKLYDDLMEPHKKVVDDKPSWSRLVSFAAFVIIMAAMAVWLITLGQVLPAIGFLLVSALPAALVVVLAKVSLPQVFGRRAPVESGELGEYLDEGGQKLVASASDRLSRTELDELEANRAAEAEATRAWAESLPGGLVFEDAETASDDGTRLVGHVLRGAPGSSKWVVFVHGLDGSYKNGLTFARRLSEAGYNLLMVDLRAHGKSGGDYLGAGWLDRRDVVAWADWLAAHEGAGVSVALMGQSMGGASVLMASAEKDLAPQVKACVADCAYTDFWNVAVLSMRTGEHGARGSSPHPLLDLQRAMFMHLPGGYDVALARPVEAVKHARVPLLLIQSEDDKSVPPFMGDELAKAAGERAQLVDVPSAGHCVAVFADPDAYYGALLGFLEKNL